MWPPSHATPPPVSKARGGRQKAKKHRRNPEESGGPLVLEMGLEPTRLAALAPQASASTNSATPATVKQKE